MNAGGVHSGRAVRAPSKSDYSPLCSEAEAVISRPLFIHPARLVTPDGNSLSAKGLQAEFSSGVRNANIDGPSVSSKPARPVRVADLAIKASMAAMVRGSCEVIQLVPVGVTSISSSISTPIFLYLLNAGRILARNAFIAGVSGK